MDWIFYLQIHRLIKNNVNNYVQCTCRYVIASNRIYQQEQSGLHVDQINMVYS